MLNLERNNEPNEPKRQNTAEKEIYALTFVLFSKLGVTPRGRLYPPYLLRTDRGAARASSFWLLFFPNKSYDISSMTKNNART